ncbi:MAG: rifamycin-inactivating phosphotransferase [Acidimicrobiia bacterium]
MTGPYVRDLRDLDRSQLAVAGGKGAQLGELTRVEGVHVPAGFCVTTDAFRRVVADTPAIGERLDELAHRDPDDPDDAARLGALGADVRRIIEGAAVPDEIATAVTGALARLGEDAACAVRSSATAEDLPGASFAGQQDSYLNVVGPAAVLGHVRRCWASLFTDRALAYRERNGIDHRSVHMAVVVQRMVVADAAGVVFTADPVTSNRTVASVEAVLGLGEDLVAGRAAADVFRVRDDRVVHRAVATKPHAVHPAPGGGTEVRAVEPARRDRPALTDAQIVGLVRLGRRIEAHMGGPQDLEWCRVGDDLQIVQSRPITTLFPIPEVGDGGAHVFVSVGHQQMMTEPMSPLGLSLWKLTAGRPMYEAAGRPFVDVAPELASPVGRARILEGMTRSDPLIGDALRTIVERGDLIPPVPDEPSVAPPAGDEHPIAPPTDGPPPPTELDPGLVTELIARTEASLAALRRDIRAHSGPALFDFVLADLQELKQAIFTPQSFQAIMAGLDALTWLDDHLVAWLGERGAADVLTRSVPHDVTSEMGLALLDVADAIRPHPEVVAFLGRVGDDGFLDRMDGLPGGPAARAAIEAWLDRYGMRCVGEIDIARPRWRERPSTLLPVILGNVGNFVPGEAPRRAEQGEREAAAQAQELLARLRALPDGEAKADEAARAIERLRAFVGYREHPKYGIVCRYDLYKQALVGEAERLVAAGVLREVDDMAFLTFAELHDVARTGRADHGLVDRRRAELRAYQALTPPRVITSEGEVVTGAYRRDEVPAGALVGLPVSAGIVEGRARVVHDMSRADLEPGDILVTAHTDPSWTPLFVVAAGLVTEVGGLMTHGAVVAREYGLPTVVGVQDATRRIPDGRRIRVHGTDGYVEILP